MGERAYFNGIFEEMKKGGREALLHFLMTHDISKFEVRDVPKTDALRDQKMMSLDADAEWWMSILRRGTILNDQDEWPNHVACDLLTGEYIQYNKSFTSAKKGNATRLNMSLRALLPDGMQRFQRAAPIEIVGPGGEKVIQRRPWCIKMPPLEDCRKHFDKEFGGPHNWAADLAAEEMPEYEDEAAF